MLTTNSLIAKHLFAVIYSGGSSFWWEIQCTFVQEFDGPDEKIAFVLFIKSNTKIGLHVPLDRHKKQV